MSFSSFIRRYFSNLYVSIVSRGDSYVVSSQVIKNSKLIDKFEKDFEVEQGADRIDTELERYLISLQEKYNYTYMTLLLDSMGQGAIKGVDAKDFEKFSVDAKNVKSVKFKNWSAYASFIDINWAHNIYKNVGLDLIYSPFVVLYYLLSQRRPQKNVVLYMLNQQNSITLSVFKDGSLDFGVFAKIEEDSNLDDLSAVSDWDEEEEVQEEGDEEFTRLENSSEDEFSALEDLAGFEEDDPGAEEDPFIDSIEEDIQDEVDTEEIDDYDIDIAGIELYGRDMKIYKFLNRALREYYNDPVYEGDFVRKMVIFDGYDMSQEILHSIENDLLLSLEIHKVNIGETVCDMSFKEANHEL